MPVFLNVKENKRLQSAQKSTELRFPFFFLFPFFFSFLPNIWSQYRDDTTPGKSYFTANQVETFSRVLWKQSIDGFNLVSNPFFVVFISTL